jgi:hypothetical protein
MELLIDCLFRIPTFEGITHTKLRLWTVAYAYRTALLLCVLVFIRCFLILRSVTITKLRQIVAWQWRMIWKGWWKKRLWPNFGYYSYIFLEKRSNSTKSDRRTQVKSSQICTACASLLLTSVRGLVSHRWSEISRQGKIIVNMQQEMMVVLVERK